MFFDNFLYDRQAQPRALFARRDIGLKQARAVGWQTDAIVCNSDRNVAISDNHGDADFRGMARRNAFFIQRFNGFSGVLNQIC